MLPTISVIIPCYNSGEYILEAIESVKRNPSKYPYEIIITDDGSTDSNTIKVLNELSNTEYKVLHQENKGPASARNTAVRESQGEFLIFLDSDNKVKPLYIDKGIKILKDNSDFGVVYANPTYFGDIKESRFFPSHSQTFSICTLLAGNYVDMCSIVRKSIWESVGGFDEDRILIGHEDWEFWIRVAKVGWRFYHIDEELFYYRITDGSLITTTNEGNKEKYLPKLKYIYEKHYELLVKCYINLAFESKTYTEDKRNPFRSFFKFFYNKYFKKQIIFKQDNVL